MSAITLTVVPGAVVDTSTAYVLTPALLSALGKPTVTGDVTVSTASIADGSITAAKYAANMISSLSAPALSGSDLVLIYDVSGSAYVKGTLTDVVALATAGASASAITLAYTAQMSTGGTAYTATLADILREAANGQTELTVTAASNDFVFIWSSAAGAGTNRNRKIKPANLVRGVTDRLFSTSGGGSAYTVTTGEALSGFGLTYRVMVRLTADCAATPTMTVDSLAAKQLRTADDRALAAGDLKSGQIGEMIYSSAANSGAGGWLWLGPLAAGGRRYTGTGAVPTTAGLASGTTFTHGLGAVPTSLTAWLVCTTINGGHAVGDRIPLDTIRAAGNDRSHWVVADSTTITVIRTRGSGTNFYNKTTGAVDEPFTPSSWTLAMTASA